MQKIISQTVDTDTSLNNQLPKFQFENGFLKYNSRIVVSPTFPWRSKIFEKHHYTPMGGHEGVLKTYQRIKRGFYWLGMKKNVKNWVTECRICQQNKYETVAPPRLL